MARTMNPHRGSTSTKALAMLGIVVVISMALPSKTSASLAAEEDPSKEEDRKDIDWACDAKSTTLGQQESFSNREDMEVGDLDFDMIEEERYPSQSPSQSPSMSLTCSDPYSNTRGVYTSQAAPCVIIFHNENALLVSGVSWNGEESEQEEQQESNPNRKRDNNGNGNALKQEDEEESGTFSHYYHGTSNVCGIENAIGEAKEYVKAWPDECVGDFARCYDLGDPNHTMCPALHELLNNRRKRRKLEAASAEKQRDPGDSFLEFDLDALVPPGTTHISVDCTIDKEALIENHQQQQEFRNKRFKEKADAQRKRTLFVVSSILGSVLITIYAISLMVVQPIVGVLRESIGSNNNRNNNNNNVGYGGNNHQLVSLVVPRTNSGLRIETDSDEFEMQEDLQTFDETETTIDTIPMDFDAVPIVPSRSPSPQQMQQQQQSALNVDAVSVLPTVHVCSQQQRPQTQQIPMDFDAVPIASATISSPQQQQQQQQQQQLRQISMDFDAVPIVPATIIPIDAVHAEVVQDGVTYYP